MLQSTGMVILLFPGVKDKLSNYNSKIIMELEASYNPLIDVLPYFLVIHTCKFGNFIYI